MDIYALDDSRMREHIVDRFESLIWTERYAELGEFQLVVQSTPLNREIFSEGRWLVHNGSYRVMVVQTTEDNVDTEGRSLFKPTGRSLEYIIQDRIAAKNMAQLVSNGRWKVSGTPGDILRHIFEEICIKGAMDPLDVIPNLTMARFPHLPEGTITEPQTVLDLELEVATLYATISEISRTYSLGFSLLLDPTSGMLHFRVDAGTNRTSDQDEVEAVVFSPELDNLSNTSELLSKEKLKNVAVVFSDYGVATVFAEGSDPQLFGFDRRVLLVKTSDIKPEDNNKQALMMEIGRRELAKHRLIMAFDGEIPQRGYRYNVDYFMGDITEMRKQAVSNYMRVTEQIFIDDSEGERSYPTLTLESYISPGSWMAWNANEAWDEVDVDLNWVDA